MSIDVQDLISNIRPLDDEAMEKARQWQARLATPPGSLGKLEDAAVRTSGITGKLKNDITRCRIIVLAADNGIIEEGIGSAPRTVTAGVGTGAGSGTGCASCRADSSPARRNRAQSVRVRRPVPSKPQAMSGFL